MAADREKAFARSMARHRDQLAELFQLVQKEDKARVRRWEDERPSLENLIASLGQSCEILKKEKKRVAADLAAAQARQATQQQGLAPPSPGKAHHQQQQQQQYHHQRGGGSDASSSRVHDVVDLERKLVDLSSRVLDIDMQLKSANEELASCDRKDEREYLSTKLVVLQVGGCAPRGRGRGEQ